MKRVILIFVLIFANLIGFSQSYSVSVSGMVIDENTGLPLPNKKVYIYTSVDSNFFYDIVYTDVNGFYTDTFDVANGIQDSIFAGVKSCEGFIEQGDFFGPDNANLTFDFTICPIVCEAAYYAEPDEEDPLTIHFHDYSAGDPFTWYWDFGDGETSYYHNPVHTYAEAGEYLVSLTISAPGIPPDSSCTSTVFHNIPVGQTWSDSCDSWFTYEIASGNSNATTVLFKAHTVSLSATFFSWDFGDGTTGRGLSIYHTYEQPGTYQVTLSSDSYNGCTSEYSDDVTVGSSGNFTLSGSVFLNHSDLSADIATVYLMAFDSVNNQLFEVAQTETAGGSYEFSGEAFEDRVYYLQAELGENSAYFGSYAPSYYQNAVNWKDAIPVLPLANPGPGYDITMQEAVGAATGNGTISGVIDGDLSRELPANIEVLLLDENNNVLTYTRSDEEGRFGFENLAYGTYVVYTEIVGINTIPGYITLSESNPAADITVNVANGEAVLGMKENGYFVRNVGEIFPNPVTSSSNIDVTLNAATQLNISIVNQVGQKINGRVYKLSEGSHRLQLDVDQLPAGIYFVTIVPQDGVKIVRKFVKTE